MSVATELPFVSAASATAAALGWVGLGWVGGLYRSGSALHHCHTRHEERGQTRRQTDENNWEKSEDGKMFLREEDGCVRQKH